MAADLIRWMTSATAQKQAAIEFGTLPTRPALYLDRDLISKIPLLEKVLPSLENAVARPSTALKNNYKKFSAKASQDIENFSKANKALRLPLARLNR